MKVQVDMGSKNPATLKGLPVFEVYKPGLHYFMVLNLYRAAASPVFVAWTVSTARVRRMLSETAVVIRPDVLSSQLKWIGLKVQITSKTTNIMLHKVYHTINAIWESNFV